LNTTISAAGDESQASPGETHQLDVFGPAEVSVFLPRGAGVAPGSSAELNMHQGSVDIDLAAILDAPEPQDFSSAAEAGLDVPSEPAGLFFDMTGPADPSGSTGAEQPDAAGAAAGRPSECP
jgi:hypothetical protein